MDCELYVADRKIENERGWQELGYRLREKNDLDRLSMLEQAPLLGPRRFLLVRPAQGPAALRIGVGTNEPLVTMPAPAPGAEVGPGYSCSHLQQRLLFFQETRKALGSLFEIAQGRRAGTQTRGEAILDVERSYFVQHKRYEFMETSAKFEYLNLLESVRPWASTSDFFSSWHKVRQLVYGVEGEKTTYCRDLSSMTEALLNQCTNCQGETFLLMALFQDAGFRPPQEWSLGIQLFRDHVRPVLYNSTTRKTFDLATGSFGPYRASIFNPEQMYVQLWKGDGALRSARETAVINSLSARYEYRDFKCWWSSETPISSDRPVSWTGLSACEVYQESDPPERADNRSKVAQVTTQESSRPAGASLGQRSELNLRTAETREGGGLSSTLQEYLRSFASTLNNVELQRILDIVQGRRPWSDFMETYSLDLVMRTFGYGHYLEDPRYRNSKFWASYVFPLRFRFDPQPVKAARILIGSSKGSPGVDRNREEILISDPELWARLKNESQLGRMALLWQDLRKRQENSIRALEKQFRSVRQQGSQVLQILSQPQMEDLLSDWRWDHEEVASFAEGEYFGSWRDRKSHQALSAFEKGHPLADAIRTDLPDSSEFGLLLIEAAAWMKNHPVEIVRWVETSTPQQREALRRVINLMPSLIAILQIDNPYLIERMNDWQVWSSETEILSQQILFQVLTHPRYFFTVKPPLNQKSATAVKVLSLSDLQIRDLEAPRPLGPAEKVQLPTWTGPSVGCGQDSSPGGIQIVVECRKRETGEKRQDPSSRALHSMTDPRIEVHLQPQTWDWLLGNIQVSGRVLSEETVTRVLLHHAYRPALAEVFRNHPLSRLWMSFNPSDFEEEFYLYDSSRWGFDSRGLLTPERLAADVHYGEFARQPFFRAALREVQTLKPGYVRFTAQRISIFETPFKSKISDYIALHQKGPLPAGFEMPIFIEDPRQPTEVYSLVSADPRVSLFENARALGLQSLEAWWKVRNFERRFEYARSDSDLVYRANRTVFGLQLRRQAGPFAPFWVLIGIPGVPTASIYYAELHRHP